jgi:hypothetical protein
MNKKNNEFETIFNLLKKVLVKYENRLTVTIDKADRYNLNAGYSEKYKRDIYFGGVEIKKNYVSFHLMPVYINPKLLNNLSPGLKKRMQGKSCFNFKKADKLPTKELSELTKNAVDFYKRNDMLRS